MKWISQKEVGYAIIIIALFVIFGTSAVHIIKSLSDGGFNLLEGIFAGHIAFLLTGLIMRFCAIVLGIWIGKQGGKTLFVGMLFIVGAILF